ncbi:MAG: DinB family protein [Dehalococcoidia bacterium]|nr:MAG: DinB family protein [Dehalococcoidia bacterium]
MTHEEVWAQGRAYLLAQAEKNDFAAAWPRVMAQRALLLAAVADVSEKQADFRPAGPPDAERPWSIAMVTRHIATSTRNVLAIIEATASGQTAPQDPIAGLGIEYPSFADARKALIDVSLELAGLLGRLPAVPNLDVAVAHFWFGPLNSRAWFLFQRLHDADHTGQIAQIRAAEGFPG